MDNSIIYSNNGVSFEVVEDGVRIKIPFVSDDLIKIIPWDAWNKIVDNLKSEKNFLEDHNVID